MKKRLICVSICFLLLGFVYFLYFNSNASTTGNVYLKSDKSIFEKDEVIEVTVGIKNVKTAAFNLELYFDDTKLDYISEVENTNVVGNRIINVWYDEAGGNEAKTGDLVKFKFKAKEDGIANFIISGEFYSEVGQLIKTDFGNLQVQIGKEKVEILQEIEQIGETKNLEAVNTNLETLAIENVLLYPPFDTNVTHYDVEVSNDTVSLNVLAVPQNESATVNINGKDDLQEGQNQITIMVTAPNGFTKKEYIVNVYKRNSEEEEKYQEEQELNRQKLEEAYNVIQTSNEEETTQENREDENANFIESDKVGIIVGGIVALIIIIIVVRLCCKKKKIMILCH